MIYLASRSHPKYLKKLIEISNRSESYNIISITGGLAFLHALNDRIESLALVDCDPEVTAYGVCLSEIIVTCKTRSEFFGLLSGREISISDAGKVLFSAVQYSSRDSLIAKLSLNTQACIARWYLPESFNDASATMTAEEKTIHFLTPSLSHQHFNWHADLGCFKTEEAYSQLNRALCRLSPKFLTMRLEDYDFETCPRNTLILASNTDSPLFTKNDSVLSSIERSGNLGCYYVSRTRDFSLKLGATSKTFADATLAPSPISVAMPPSLIPYLDQSYPQRWRHLSSQEYCADLLYDQECLLFWISEIPSQLQDELLDHLSRQAPLHQRIGILSDNLPSTLSRISEIFRRYSASEDLQVGNFKGILYSLTCRCAY